MAKLEICEKITQMGIKCECVIECKQAIRTNISNKPTLIMSVEKNDWLTALYVTGIKCNCFNQMKACDTL